MPHNDASGFLRIGAGVCLFGAVTSLLNLALPRDSGLLDILVAIVSLFWFYLSVGLASGLSVLRPGVLATIAAVGLLARVWGPPLVFMLGLPPNTGLVLVGIHVVGIAALALLLVPIRTLIDIGLVGAAVGGAMVTAISDWLGHEVLTGSGHILTLLSLAVLFERSRRAAWTANSPSTLEVWRRADDGARIVLLAEKGRLAILAIAFVGAGLARTVGAVDVLGLVITAGHSVLIAMSTLGLAKMFPGRGGNVWSSAGIGIGVAALGCGFLEVLAMALGFDNAVVGMATVGRIVGHGALVILAALAIGEVGRRAGDDEVIRDARRTAWAYLGLFWIAYLVVFARDVGAPRWIAVGLGLALLLGIVVAVGRLVSLVEDVRLAIPSGAANDIFGGKEEVDDPPTGQG